MSLKSLPLLLVLPFAVGCASFDSLSPNGAMPDLTKGVWVAKSSTFLGIRIASQEVLYCEANNPATPHCARAHGDTEAAKAGSR